MENKRIVNISEERYKDLIRKEQQIELIRNNTVYIDVFHSNGIDKELKRYEIYNSDQVIKDFINKLKEDSNKIDKLEVDKQQLESIIRKQKEVLNLPWYKRIFI